jgi:hypothetical protein
LGENNLSLQDNYQQELQHKTLESEMSSKLTICACRWRHFIPSEEMDALIRAIGGRYTDEVIAWRYLQPGCPNPTHRFDQVYTTA